MCVWGEQWHGFDLVSVLTAPRGARGEGEGSVCACSLAV